MGGGWYRLVGSGISGVVGVSGLFMCWLEVAMGSSGVSEFVGLQGLPGSMEW